MGQQDKPEIGSITWVDLTVPNAAEVKDFYHQVVGWNTEPVSMGDYDDYNMNGPASGKTFAGICHARGVNSDLPAQWLIYITVEDVDSSAAKVKELGGKIISGPNDMGSYGRSCVIQDPSGAVATLYQPADQ